MKRLFLVSLLLCMGAAVRAQQSFPDGHFPSIR